MSWLSEERRKYPKHNSANEEVDFQASFLGVMGLDIIECFSRLTLCFKHSGSAYQDFVDAIFKLDTELLRVMELSIHS